MTRTLVLEHSLKRRTLQLLLFLYYAIIYSWRRTRRPPIKTFFESLRTHDRERENMIYWTHGEQSKIKLFRLNFSYNAKRPPFSLPQKVTKRSLGPPLCPTPPTWSSARCDSASRKRTREARSAPLQQDKHCWFAPQGRGLLLECPP